MLLFVALVPFYLSIVALHYEMLRALWDNQTWQAFSKLAAIGLGPVACLRVVLRLIVENVPPYWKERLCHLRWHDPLPGSRADKLIQSDARVDLRSLPSEAQQLLDSSMTPRERNAYWYNHIYRLVRDIPAVSNTHRRYLLYREASVGAFITVLVIMLLDIVSRTVFDFNLMTLLAYFASVGYVLLLIGAAIQAGNRMVTGAVANYINAQPCGDL